MNPTELKQLLVEMVIDLKRDKYNISPFKEGQIATLEVLIQWVISIMEGNTMQSTKDQLKMQVVKLSDIEPRRRSSELDAKIKEWLKSFDDGEALEIPDAEIRHGHLAAKISKMKKDKSVPTNTFVVKRGEKVYLAKK